VVRALDDPHVALWAGTGRTRVLEAGAPALHVERLSAIYREAIAAR
jgi:hypothetical protein